MMREMDATEKKIARIIELAKVVYPHAESRVSVEVRFYLNAPMISDSMTELCAVQQPFDVEVTLYADKQVVRMNDKDLDGTIKKLEAAVKDELFRLHNEVDRLTAVLR